jgi:hypothetical protein
VLRTVFDQHRSPHTVVLAIGVGLSLVLRSPFDVAFAAAMRGVNKAASSVTWPS